MPVRGDEAEATGWRETAEAGIFGDDEFVRVPGCAGNLPPVRLPTMNRRTLPIGAEVLPGGAGVHFRVWAPRRGTVAVEFVERGVAAPLAAEPGGYFAGRVPEARAGERYRLRLDGGAFPDPAARFQPAGPHGPSQIVDPRTFAWTDAAWRGRPRREHVLYELHLGTFTPEGTWMAALAELPELARIGVTVLEVMPVAEFGGRRGWGYDGVNLFAPSHRYGGPDDMRRFVNRAHELGLLVILDVVYNHLGPDGNYLWEFSRDYFNTQHRSEWGETLNYDGPDAGAVREFFTANACHWIAEYHLDGLRFDATQQIVDTSPTHILREIADAARAAAGGRPLLLVAESEPQLACIVRPKDHGGYGLDALWTDDFHHVARIAAAGRSEAYLGDYRGTAAEFVAAAKGGFIYQGQWSRWQRKRRGSPTAGLGPGSFIFYLQNHDQIANSLRGLRLHQLTTPGRHRALTALLLLLPQTPLLFQGQEFAASAPFLYFSDHPAELQAKIREGRHDFLRQFPSIACPESSESLDDPGAEETFRRCRLDLTERAAHAAAYRLHEDLLRIRREDPAIVEPATFDGAVLAREAFVLRYGSTTGDDRLLLVNLGPDLRYAPAPEPLLAPPAGRGWTVRWSSEAPLYGGGGTPPVETTEGWFVPAHAAMLLRPHENDRPPAARLHEKD